MLVKRTSSHSGKVHVKEIPINIEQMEELEVSGKVPSGLSKAHARFLSTGTTEEEWESMLAEMEKFDKSDNDRRYHR